MFSASPPQRNVGQSRAAEINITTTMRLESLFLVVVLVLGSSSLIAVIVIARRFDRDRRVYCFDMAMAMIALVGFSSRGFHSSFSSIRSTIDIDVIHTVSLCVSPYSLFAQLRPYGDSYLC